MAQPPRIRKSIDGIVRTADNRPSFIHKHEPEIASAKFLSLQQARGRVDGVLPRPQKLHPNSVAAHKQQQARPAPVQPKKQPAAKPVIDRHTEVVMRVSKTHSVRAKLFSVIQYILVAAIALVAAYSTGIGQWFVLAYGIYVLVRRLSSQLTFGIALFLLVAIPIFTILKQTGVANNIAVYVFELLVVGTVQAIVELKWPRQHPKKPVQ